MPFLIRATTQFTGNCLLRRVRLQPLRYYSSSASPTGPAENKPPAATGSTQQTGENGTGGARRGGSGILKLMGFTTLVGGGVMVAFYYSKDFRNWMIDNVPYSSTTMEFLDGYLQQIPYISMPQIDWTRSKQASPKPLAHSSQNPIINEKPQPKPEPAKPEQLPVSSPQLKSEPVEPEKLPVSSPLPSAGEVEEQMAAHGDQLQLDSRVLISSLRSAARDTSSITKKAIAALIDLETKTRQHAENLKKAIEDDGAVDKGLWSNVSKSNDIKNDAKGKADPLSEEAKHSLDHLRSTIESARTNAETKSNTAIPEAQRQLTDLQYNLSAAITAVHKAQSEANMITQYRDLVEKSKAQLQKELEGVLPEVSKTDQGKLTEDELNSLIAHAHLRIQQLQRRVAEMQALEKARINSALASQRQEDEILADERVSREVERERNNVLIEKQKWETEARVEFETELRQALARQAAAHSDHLGQVLRVQRSELERMYKMDLREATVQQKEEFHAALEGWTNRMRAVEDVVEGRAELDRIAKESQTLWAACQVLLRVLTEGAVGRDDTGPLSRHLRHIRDAARPDARVFVQEIIDRIPEEAVNNGVATERSLVNRFKKVNKVCRYVALVKETGGTLGTYFLSWLQSHFIVEDGRMLASVWPTTKHDTFTLLTRAQAAIDTGDLELALRLVNQLEGQSHAVASDWLHDSRLMLEARQAAEVLLAFAAARNLGALEARD